MVYPNYNYILVSSETLLFRTGSEEKKLDSFDSTPYRWSVSGVCEDPSIPPLPLPTPRPTIRSFIWIIIVFIETTLTEFRIEFNTNRF